MIIANGRFEIKLPQNSGDNFLGDKIEFYDDGQLSIGGYDGITVLTREQAKRLGEKLIAWAEA